MSVERSPAELIEAHQRRLDAINEQPIPKNASALEVLQMGYRGEVKLTP